MTAFVRATLDDIHHGVETWRVRLTLAIPAFLVAAAVALVRMS